MLLQTAKTTQKNPQNSTPIRLDVGCDQFEFHRDQFLSTVFLARTYKLDVGKQGCSGRICVHEFERDAEAKKSVPGPVKAEGMVPLTEPRGVARELKMLPMGWTLDLGQTSLQWHFYHFLDFTQGFSCRSWQCCLFASWLWRTGVPHLFLTPY